jgi:putative zinc finger/helix-turn-helix YgiT family protein
MAVRTISRKCGKCRKLAVALATVPYRVQVDHDGRKYDVTIPALEVSQCANCGTIKIDAAAEKAIDDAFRREAGLLTPEQIRAGRQRLGLTQQDLADHLGVAVSTLSRWENGVQVQQRSLDLFLRLFFVLPDVRAALTNRERLSASYLDGLDPAPAASSA